MGRYSEVVRFLDNLDLTVSYDNRATSAHQMSNIDITMKPVVIRASYRDINLIMSIVNRAIELYTQSQQPTSPSPGSQSRSPVYQTTGATSTVSPTSRPLTQGKAVATVSKEQVGGKHDIEIIAFD